MSQYARRHRPCLPAGIEPATPGAPSGRALSGASAPVAGSEQLHVCECRAHGTFTSMQALCIDMRGSLGCVQQGQLSSTTSHVPAMTRCASSVPWHSPSVAATAGVDAIQRLVKCWAQFIHCTNEPSIITNRHPSPCPFRSNQDHQLTGMKPARRQVLEREKDSLVHVWRDDHAQLTAPRSSAGNRWQSHLVKEVCPEQRVP